MSAVQPFDLFNGSGERIAWSEFVCGPTLLLFMSGDCAACDLLAEQLVDVDQDVEGVPLIVLIDSPQDGHALPSGLRVLYQFEQAATHAFANRATPQAYVVDETGVVLDRRVPGSVADLREMALLQRKGGDDSKTLQFEFGAPR
jgi:thiol-disulfide isomerase/thioredoxin